MKYFTLALLLIVSLVHGLHVAVNADKVTTGRETIIRDSALYKRAWKSSADFDKYQQEQEERERQHLISERDALRRRIMQLTTQRDYSARAGDERNVDEYNRAIAALMLEVEQINNRIRY